MSNKYARAVSAAPLSIDDNGRCIRYVLSDSTVARDGNRIMTDGWVLTNFRKNPVFLWAHDVTTPPIGRVVDIGVSGDTLTGTVEYAAPADNPFADTIYRLVKNGFLNAVSVAWNPLQWKYSSAPGRRSGAIDFTSQELLEVSQVPVPALASALVTARARGINTGPLADWAERILSVGQTQARAPAGKAPARTQDTVADRLERVKYWQSRKKAAEAREAFQRLNGDPDILAMRLLHGKVARNERERREFVVIRRRGAEALRRKYADVSELG